MGRITLKGLLAHKLRLALTALAIVLGVTFIAGTFVLTDTLHNTFTTLFSNIYQNVDFEVRGVAEFQQPQRGRAVRNPIPESILPTVRRVPGVETAAGTVQGFAQFVDTSGKAISTGGAPTYRGLLRPRPEDLGAAPRAGRGSDHPPRGGDGRGHRPEVPLPGRGPGRGPSCRTVSEVHHQRHRPFRHCQRPGRGDPRGVRPADRPGRPQQGRPVQRRQRGGPTRSRQGCRPA